MTVHKNLTGADLHEPKGADTATSGQVYVANGAGSGTWTDASSVITNQAFTTGDIKATFKTTADSTWVMMNDGTIGDGSSGATTRANADTSDLFTLLWTNISNTYAAVSGGRGASAAADFAAHKTIALPKALGRAMFASGAGSGLTSRSLGQTGGAETVTLSSGNIPSLTSTGSNSISVTGTAFKNSVDNFPTVASGGIGLAGFTSAYSVGSVVSTGSNSISVTYTNASPTAVAILNPYFSVNFMIKL